MSPNTISNTIAAAIPTFAIILFWLWKPIGRLLLPFHKSGDAFLVGFFSLGNLANPRPFAGHMYRRVSLPLFVTVYVVNLLLIEAVSYPRALEEPRDILFLIGLWLFVLAYAGSVIPTIATAAIPFLLGYFIFGQSFFAGSMALVIVVAVWYAASYPQFYVLRDSMNALRSIKHAYLNGEQTRFPRFDCSRHIIGRWVRKILVIPLAVQVCLLFSGSEVFSVFTNGTVLARFGDLILLLVYGLFALDILLGGIFGQVQLDLFTALGNHAFGKKGQVAESMPDDKTLSEEDYADTATSKPFVSSTDQVIDLRQLHLPNFRIALSFVAIDIFLSILSVTDLPLLPGLSLRDIDLLAATIKLPYVLNVISMFYLDGRANRGHRREIIACLKQQNGLEAAARPAELRILRFLQRLRIRSGQLTQSPTIREESAYRTSVRSSLKDLLNSILKEQQSLLDYGLLDYIDIRDNLYLRSLADDSPQFEGKVHF